MPSKARNTFEKRSLIDVERLIDLYNEVKPDTRGRKHLGHLTRSCVVMLCAGWEVYIEDILQEAVEFLCKNVKDPSVLSKEVQKKLAKHMREKKDELAIMNLAGNGWKECLMELVQTKAQGLNNPKKDQINELFEQLIGLKNLSVAWGKNAPIDSFVARRGEIAHKGGQAGYVQIGELEGYVSLIKETVEKTDEKVRVFLNNLAKKPPWHRPREKK